METLLIIALLAGNIFLIGKVMRKLSSPPPKPDANSDARPDSSVDKATETADANIDDSHSEDYSEDKEDESIVGKSHVDLDRLNAIIEAKVKAEMGEVRQQVKEEVERVVAEYTKPEDVGLPEEDDSFIPAKQIPKDELDRVFTHHSVSEAEGEPPAPAPPRTDGHDFSSLETAVRVATGQPHTAEDVQIAKKAYEGIRNTVIEDRISLDPKVRTRILTIFYSDSEDEPVTTESLSKKKVVFSGTIDTFDVDKLNVNILT